MTASDNGMGVKRQPAALPAQAPSSPRRPGVEKHAWVEGYIWAPGGSEPCDHVSQVLWWYLHPHYFP